MKRFLLLLFICIISFSQAQEKDIFLDSLMHELSVSDNNHWVDIAIEISKEISYKDAEYAQTIIEEAIKNSISIDYQDGLSRAYEQKAILLYNEHKILSGISYFQKAYGIYSFENKRSESANILYGIASGLARIHQISEAKDTLSFILNNYPLSIDPQTKSNIYHLFSNIYSGEGEIEKAIEALDSAVVVEKNNYLLENLSTSYNALGVIFDDLGDYKRSLEYYDLCEITAKNIHDTLLTSYAIHNKAYIYLYWGIFDEALSLFLESQDLVQSAGYESELVASVSSIAAVYQEIEKNDKAKRYYKKALQLADKYNDLTTKAVIYHNMGEMMFGEGKLDSALYMLNQSLRIEMQEGNTLGIAQTKSLLGTIHSALNDYDISFTYFKEAENVFLKFGSKNDLSNLYLEYGKTYASLRKDSLSIIFFQKGIDLAEKINNRSLLKDGYQASSHNYERLYNYRKALFFYKKHKSITDSLFNQHTSRRMDYMSLKLETQEKEKRLSSLENKQKVLQLENKNRTTFLLAAIIILILSIFFFYWRFTIKKNSEARLSKQYHILEESEQKIKALIDSSFDSTLLVNLQGNILTINNNKLNGFFANTESMIHEELFSFFNSPNKEKLDRFFKLVIQTKKPKELEIQEANGFVLNIRISPVIDPSNHQVSSLAFYIKDITQLEKDKQAREKMEKQLIQTQKMETIGTLAGGIAHDFNNSLATIQGYVSMSLEDVDPKSHIHRYLKNTQKAVNISRDTVQKLMTYSRANEIQFNKVRISELLDDSVDMIMGSKPKNIKFVYPHKRLNMELLADKNQLTQVMVNICTNAIHSIGEQAGTVTIKVQKIKSQKRFKNKNMILIQICDDGIGMDSETQKRIFEPFYTTKEVGKGTGLGLSVVAGIIKQHSGIIEVKSQFGKGASFLLYLPIISE
ncbi:MAG: hypothetical protein B7C24_04220 [Bacteroidetes bacterium 4572_77]|nr:MAG: hypothetical protein B7C24_04220 [Bacteroidetes bacterium 4572_77]